MAAEYLQLLGSLARELERAMRAIAQTPFQISKNSVSNQQDFEQPAYPTRESDLHSPSGWRLKRPGRRG